MIYESDIACLSVEYTNTKYRVSQLSPFRVLTKTPPCRSPRRCTRREAAGFH